MRFFSGGCFAPKPLGMRTYLPYGLNGGMAYHHQPIFAPQNDVWSAAK